MRKSVERRMREMRAHSTSSGQHSYRRVFVLLAVCIGIAGLVGSGIAVKNHLEATQREADQKASAAQNDKQTAIDLNNKFKKAQQAESDAKSTSIVTALKRNITLASAPMLADEQTIAKSTTNCGVTNPGSITVVINKKHCFSPLSWAPSDLVSVNGYYMRSQAASAMQSMMSAANNAGVGFSLSSAYRSYSDQVATYNNWVAVNGSQAAADTVSARAGYSEHQTGLAADLKVGSCALECFADSAQYKWLTKNAAKYGFIQRYPTGLTSITGYSPEAWHWRYVGVAVAEDMKARGTQTLEQYYGISGGDYAG